MQTHVDGIPCTVKYKVSGKYVPAKVNALPEDCYEAEYPEVEFTLCDLAGNPAPWLDAKMSDEDRQRIEEEILADWSDND
jgi:hypothetical protein